MNGLPGVAHDFSAQVTLMADFVAWHGKTLSEHEAARDQYAAKGYRFVSLSIYGAVGTPFFAAVMMKRPVVVTQRDFPCLTAAQFQQIVRIFYDVLTPFARLLR